MSQINTDIHLTSLSKTWHLDFMIISCYFHEMAILQVKNVPDSLHKRLKKHAKKVDKTLSDVILEAVEKELKRSEWRERFTKRPSSNLGVSAASLLEEERQERDKEL